MTLTAESKPTALRNAASYLGALAPETMHQVERGLALILRIQLDETLGAESSFLP
ncbi:hypothetical protein [Mycobacterium sp.]|uniref:hypothetical protein n=1 Tax=Mycobacterium sp. TaxID=1785 RepID=UPI0031D913FB